MCLDSKKKILHQQSSKMRVNHVLMRTSLACFIEPCLMAIYKNQGEELPFIGDLSLSIFYTSIGLHEAFCYAVLNHRHIEAMLSYKRYRV